MPLEEIRRRAHQFEKRISRRNLREYIGGAIGVAVFTYYIFKFPSPVARTGCALIIAGLLCILIQIYKRASPGKLPADLALTASLAYHRSELVRQRSVWWWYLGPIVPGIVVFAAGLTPPRTGVAMINALPFFCILGLIIWANYRAAAALDRRIAELDSLSD
jgi:uncharacterized membrane protein YdcZ (DUF606 family)